MSQQPAAIEKAFQQVWVPFVRTPCRASFQPVQEFIDRYGESYDFTAYIHQSGSLRRNWRVARDGMLKRVVRFTNEERKQAEKYNIIISMIQSGLFLGDREFVNEWLEWVSNNYPADKDYSTRFKRSMFLLRAAHWDRGFIEYRTRFAGRDKEQEQGILSIPEWDGYAPVMNRRLLLMTEQGAGDNIMFLRYAKQLKEMGALLVVYCSDNLIRLLEDTGLFEEVVAANSPVRGIDFRVYIVDLPGIFKTTEENPSESVYLTGKPGFFERAGLAHLIDPTKLKIGVVWRGNPQYEYNWFRSVALPLWDPIFAAARGRCQFFSIQVGDISNEAHDCVARWGLIDPTPMLKDFVETRDLIYELDLVITVDTSVGHLTGSMGKPYFLYLPNAPDWRWPLEGSRSFWYPSATLFVQEEYLQWDDIVANVASALEEFIDTTTPIAIAPPAEIRYSDPLELLTIFQAGKRQYAVHSIDQLMAELGLEKTDDVFSTLRAATDFVLPKRYAPAVDSLKASEADDSALGSFVFDLFHCHSEMLLHERKFLEAANSSGTAWAVAETMQLDMARIFPCAISHCRALHYTGTDDAAFLRAAGRLNTMRAVLKENAELDADSPQWFACSQVLLRAGIWEAAYPDYLRWRAQSDPNTIAKIAEGIPNWDGTSELAGQTVLVIGEVGIGDTIMMVSYMPLLRARGATLLACVHEGLVSLFQQSGYFSEVFPFTSKVQGSNYKVRMFDLPALFQTTPASPASLPQAHPFLTVQGGYYIEKMLFFPQDRLRIGLGWQGERTHPDDWCRSMRVSDWQPLLGVRADAQFYSLQMDKEGRELLRYESADEVAGMAKHMDDFLAMARLIQGLDLVITVDTVFAHLASALGVPVFLCLSTAPDWRWGNEGREVQWYPKMRFFRQSKIGDWQSVIAEVSTALEEFVAPVPVFETAAEAYRAYQEGRRNGVEAFFREWLLTHPSDTDSLRVLAAILSHQSSHEEATTLNERALKLLPKATLESQVGIDLYKQLINNAKALQDKPKAVHWCAELCKLFPINPQFLLQHAEALEFNGVINKAIKKYGEALGQFDRMHYQAEDDAAKEELQKFIANTRLKRGMLMLKTGEWDNAWSDYRARFEVHPLNRFMQPNIPLWDGKTSLEGKNILALTEQGNGDFLMLLRYIKLLKQKGATTHTITEPELYELTLHNKLFDHVTTIGGTLTRPDFQVFMFDLLAIFGTTPATIPNDIPYITGTSSESGGFFETKKVAFDSERLNVGIVWGGDPSHVNDWYRSCPLKEWAPIFAAAQNCNAQLYSFQVGKHAEALAQSQTEQPIIDLAPHLNNYLDTANALDDMDLIIAIDSSVIHLAGAMGIPACLLLADIADWRWLLEVKTTNWYPSVRIYRQDQPKQWSKPIGQVAKLVEKAARKKAAEASA